MPNRPPGFFLTVTLHPSIDRILRISKLEPGKLISGELLLQVPAGKGINTARSLRHLLPDIKHNITALAWLGADAVKFFKYRLKAEGIRANIVARTCPTRISTTILEHQQPRETHLKEHMARASSDEVNQLRLHFERLALRNRLVACCGSAPEGIDMTTLKSLYSLLVAQASHVVVDGQSNLLQAAIAAGVYGIKGNAEEIAEWLGLDGAFDPACAEHLGSLHKVVEKAVRRTTVFPVVCITLGADGAVLIDRSTCCWARPPASLDRFGKVLSGTGCGDAATAGWLFSLHRQLDLPASARRIVACGTLKLLSADPGKIDRNLFERLQRSVYLRIK